MPKNNDLLSIFLEETYGYLSAIELSLLELEKDPKNRKQLDLLFRMIHTIKGGAGLLNLKKITALSHSMENLLGEAREQKIILKKEHINALLAGYDCLLKMLKDPVHSEKIDMTKEHQYLEILFTQQIKPLEPSKFSRSIELVPDHLPKNSEVFLYEVSLFMNKDLPRLKMTFSETLAKLDTSGKILDSHLTLENKQLQPNQQLRGNFCFVFSYLTPLNITTISEMLMVPQSQINLIPPETLQKNNIELAEKEPLEENLQEILSEETALTLLPAFVDTTQEMNESIRVNLKRLNRLLDLAGELVLVRNQIFRMEKLLDFSKVSGFKGILQNFNRITTDLQEVVMNTRMQAVGMVFNKTPRLLRELTSTLGKKIDVTTEGGEVELDKSMIEALADPMTHIIRNAVDHGMESPEERIKKGKLPNGVLLQKAFHKGEYVLIQISDDGRGINPERIESLAIEKGFITSQETKKMTDQEKINLIFIPGFSTSESISSVSGRGVGMDVVKHNIEGIGGKIEIASVVDKGTTITIVLPLTMAIIPCIIAQNQKSCFAFPQINVEEMLLLEANEYTSNIEEIQDNYVLRLRGKLILLISLEKGLNPNSKISYQESVSARIKTQPLLNIFIIKSEHHRAAVIVDKILGSEEIVVKPIPEYLKQIKSFSGTTILGDGSVAMIINALGLMENTSIVRIEEKIKKNLIEDKTNHLYEKESLLIFNNGTPEIFALPIPLIRRVDSIQLKEIQKIGDKEYIEYRGEQVVLIRLEDHLPIQKPSNQQEALYIIFPKNIKNPVAFLIHKVIDSIDVVVKLERVKILDSGILGSFLLEKKIILLLDLYGILEIAEPDCISTKIVLDKEKTKKYHLLLVEDTPFFMKVVKDYLVHIGYTISTATNGREALEKLREQKFDLVLTDIEMPIMNGKDLLKSIRANPNWSGLPVIAITSLSGEEMIREGKKSGFNEWLVKLNKEQLFQTLQKYL
ncbi:MAG: chemotaxis protein CheW [Planctomycetota bacterium]